MFARTFYRDLILIGVLLSVGLVGAAENDITDAGLRALFGPAAAAAPVVKEAPRVDGRLDDAAWAKAPKIRLHYADERVEGTPIFGAWVKVADCGDALYVAFRTEGKPAGKMTSTDDVPAILRGHYVGVVWKAAAGAGKTAVFAVLINPRGAVYHARRIGAEGEWEGGWKPTGVKAARQRTDIGWNAEIKLPKKLFRGADGKVRRIVKMDFVRRFWYWLTPRKGLKLLRSLHAWKTRSVAANRRLVRLDIFPDDDFGRLYLRTGEASLAPETVRRLRAASKAAVAKKEATRQARHERRPGFEFSEAELEKFFPGAPIILTPLVKHGPKVDGDPRDEVWGAAPVVALNFLSSKIHGRPRRNRTFVRTVSDDRNLYFLFVCEEKNLSALRAVRGLVDEGELWREDICNVLLDVGRLRDEGTAAYIDFLINAAGSVDHARRRSDTSWDPRSFKVRTRLWPERKQWTLEMKVSFRDLGVAPDNFPKVWGANFLRSRTSGRGVWIDRLQTKDPAYLNFDFAWRGNLNASPHRPDLFGVLYLQAGNALPDELYEALLKRDGAKVAAGLKRWRPPVEKPLPVSPPAAPAKVAFAEKPAVRVENRRVEIRFALAAPAPVSVAVLDEKGKIVRTLAAGMLGKNAPPPLKAGSLKQQLYWDFTDNFGRKVTPGKYIVRVGAGLSVERERFVMFNPGALREVQGLSVDGQGNVYVLEADHFGWHYAPLLLVFDRNGKYLRQLIPYSGSLPAKKLTAARRIKLPGGRMIPTMFHGIHQPFAPAQANFGPERFAVAPSGKVVLLNRLRSTETRFPKRLLLIGPAGGMGTDYLGPVLGPQALTKGVETLALSPDGRYVYITGLRGGLAVYEGHGLQHEGTLSVHHVVYRLDLQKKDQGARAAGFPKPFLGELEVPGKDAGRHFRDPRGVAVDRAGNIYVADFGNDRIAAFSAEGKFRGALSVPRPAQVEVHPRTGALYVVSLEKQESVLRKFSGLRAKAASLSLKLPRWTWVTAALDSSTIKPRLWLTGRRPSDRRGVNAVLAVDEKKDGFENLGTLIADTGYEILKRRYGLPAMVDCRIGPDGGEAIIWGVGFDTTTGRATGTGRPILQRGRDGRLYQKKRKPRGIFRYDARNKPAFFPATPAGYIVPRKGTFDFDVGRDGRVYVLHSRGVDVYAPDGSLETKDFISIPGAPRTSNGANGTIRVDRDGGVYLNLSMKPPGPEIPPELVGRLPAVERRPSLPFVYRHLYGSVVKFGPKGGRVRLDKKGDEVWCCYGSGKQRCKAKGVKWVRLGFSPLRYRNVENVPCSCEVGRFDVDGFGRVFYPDALRFSVEVLDSAGNRLLRFGRYGNMDDDFKFPGEPSQPALAWPVDVQVRGDHVFVVDRLNKRVVKLRLRHAAEDKTAIRVP